MSGILFDFTSESQAEARIAKHEYVIALLQHQGDWISGFLDEKLDNLLQEYSRKGAHWMPSGQSAVKVGDTGA